MRRRIFGSLANVVALVSTGVMLSIGIAAAIYEQFFGSKNGGLVIKYLVFALPFGIAFFLLLGKEHMFTGRLKSFAKFSIFIVVLLHLITKIYFHFFER